MIIESTAELLDILKHSENPLDVRIALGSGLCRTHLLSITDDNKIRDDSLVDDTVSRYRSIKEFNESLLGEAIQKRQMFVEFDDLISALDPEIFV